MKDTTTPVKTHIAFTASFRKTREEKLGKHGERTRKITDIVPDFLHAHDEEAAKLASAIIHRIENPDAPSAWLNRVKEGKPFKQMTRKASLSQKPRKPLSLEDKQDIFQQVMCMMLQGAHVKGERIVTHDKEGKEIVRFSGVSEIFRSVRDMLYLNGGNHDRTYSDSLETLQALKPHTLLNPHETEAKKRERRLRLADNLRQLRKDVFFSSRFDKSRKASSNRKGMLKIVRNIASGANPLSILKREALEHDARRQQWKTLRDFIQIGEDAKLGNDLALQMSALS